MTNTTDKKPAKKGTLSLGGGTLGARNSGNAGSGGVAVEVRKRRFTNTAAAVSSKPSVTVDADSEMARRMQALEAANENAAAEEAKRSEEKKQAEDLRKARGAEEIARKEREESTAQRKAEEEALRAKQEQEEKIRKDREEALRIAASQPSKPVDDNRKTLSVSNKKGKPGGDSSDAGKKRGRNAYQSDLEQRYRTMNASRRKQKHGRQQSKTQEKVIREVLLPDYITVQELAKRMTESGGDVVKKLMLMGQMVTLTQTIDQETAALIVEEFGHSYKLVSESDIEIGLVEEDDAAEHMITRPPVVTVMGHVDHGKTSLLDALRKTDVADGEAGGITQHIGAYQIKTEAGKRITFLDTPGHEAFTSMRARGANCTDIAILVVAADDGVMPQTIESIQHAKAAGVPIVVAVNKCDKPEANPERVKQELLNHDLIPEEFGGDIVCVNVSAKAGTGLEELEEMVLLQAEVLDLQANDNRRADGVVVESRLDKGRGSIATVIVQRGTLKQGDIIVAGSVWGRVRALMNDRGQRIEEAGPSTPVEILGISGVPEAGDQFAIAATDRQAKEIAEFRDRKKREKAQAARGSKLSLDNLFARIEEGEVQDLPVLIKADVQGSVEAIRESLTKLSTDEVKVSVLHGAVGVITESDIMLASASNTLVVGFNVRAGAQARELASAEGIEIRYYNVIYNLIDDVKSAMSGLLSPEVVEEIVGNVEIRDVFKVNKVTIAGCYVTDGVVKRNSKIRVIREGVVIAEDDIGTLRRFKDDAKEVAQNFECGITLEKFADIAEGDVLEVYETKEVARTIDDVQAAKEKAARDAAKEKAEENDD